MPTLPVARCSVCHRRPSVSRGLCGACAATSSRNHRGIPRRARGHGADYDQLAREFRGQPCALRLDDRCTGYATGADLIVPRSRGGLTVRSNARPACAQCQSIQGGRIAGEIRRRQTR